MEVEYNQNGENMENMENMVSFQEYLLNKGYFFDSKIIENYLLSIKIKPFVIFTGNSGTGKTKLSQLFAEYISETYNKSVENNLHLIENEEYLLVNAPVNPSSINHNVWTLNKKSLYGVLPIKEIERDFDDLLIDNIPAKGHMSIIVQLTYDKNDHELKDYLENLFSMGADNSVDLKINLNAFKQVCDDYSDVGDFIILEQKSNSTAYKKTQWIMDFDIFRYLPVRSGKIPCDIFVDDIKSNANLDLKLNYLLRKMKNYKTI